MLLNNLFVGVIKVEGEFSICPVFIGALESIKDGFISELEAFEIILNNPGAYVWDDGTAWKDYGPKGEEEDEVKNEEEDEEDVDEEDEKLPPQRQGKKGKDKKGKGYGSSSGSGKSRPGPYDPGTVMVLPTAKQPSDLPPMALALQHQLVKNNPKAQVSQCIKFVKAGLLSFKTFSNF